ncbi:group II intron reverse transcriptase/maturase [Bacillus infantis]|uniref:group II intron reverse transcriptase/maturase n=1 Tax=Bacillus infantis TaxID=324767 RepID=UPI00344E6EAA
MRNPDDVLNSLASKSHDVNYKFQRIYRNLYNPEFFLKAYSKIYAKEGNMTEGTDGKTIDGMSMERINKLIESLKDLSYQPKPARRVYIPKSNGGKRPLGIPSVDDKLVQEVVRSILQCIYEGSFSKDSHGFRPNRSCHTALKQVEKDFKGMRWFVEGDIKGFFDNINHETLIKLLRKRIDDEKFIQLIWKFIKAGYIEDWKYNTSFSGTPQGGIISPILSNIYLNELDKHMKQLAETFNKGIKRDRNPVYRQLENKIRRLRRKLEEESYTLSPSDKKMRIKEMKNLKIQLLNMEHGDHLDENFKRLRYVRYADDFLIGLIGSKEDATSIKENLTVFLMEHLNLELSQEKTLITNTKDKARFLGYDVSVSRNQSFKRDKNNVLKRSFNFKVLLQLPKEKWVNNLLEKGALKINNNVWKPNHRPSLRNLDDLEILSTYNAEIRGLYEYYKLAINVSVLNKYSHFMEYSLYKTLANKYKTTISKIITKNLINGDFGIRYKTRDGWKIRYFYKEGFKWDNKRPSTQEIDTMPYTVQYTGRTSLIDRMLAEKCEWCGKENSPLEIHHVKKLKDLKGKKTWEQIMISRQRKTMALCKECHTNLHQGRLD